MNTNQDYQQFNQPEYQPTQAPMGFPESQQIGGAPGFKTQTSDVSQFNVATPSYRTAKSLGNPERFAPKIQYHKSSSYISKPSLRSAQVERAETILKRYHQAQNEVKAQEFYRTLNWILLGLTNLSCIALLIIISIFMSTDRPADKPKEGDYYWQDFLDIFRRFGVLMIIVTIIYGILGNALFYKGVKAYNDRDDETFSWFSTFYIVFLVLNILCVNLVGIICFAYFLSVSPKLRDSCHKINEARVRLDDQGISYEDDPVNLRA